MSVRQSELAWQLDLSSNRKFVLLELADHADPDGGHVFPSQGFIAMRTGYSTRQIRRILRELEVCPDPTDGECRHETPHLGLIEPVAHGKGGRGMATEYHLHLDANTNEKAVKLSGFIDSKTRTSATQKADIHDIKADICDIKADVGVLPIVNSRHINGKETPEGEVSTSPSGDSPDWFVVLSGLERFGQSFEICQNWITRNNIPEAMAKTQAYGLRDWLSRQKAGSKAVRGDPWTRFTSWCIRDLDASKNTQPDNSPDKYALAKLEAERRGQ
jgi:hypothetical protein